MKIFAESTETVNVDTLMEKTPQQNLPHNCIERKIKAVGVQS